MSDFIRVTMTVRMKFQGVKVSSLLKALKLKEIWRHLNLNDKKIINEINERFKIQKFVETEDMKVIYEYYHNFVCRDFRYK